MKFRLRKENPWVFGDSVIRKARFLGDKKNQKNPRVKILKKGMEHTGNRINPGNKSFFLMSQA